MVTFAHWLNNVSVTQLARDLGVSRQAIYNWARGDHLPAAATLQRLEEISNGKVTARSFPRQEAQA